MADEPTDTLTVRIPRALKALVEETAKARGIVKTFLDADAAVPKPVILYLSADRYVAKLLEERRKFPVLKVIDALEGFAQPGLLESGSAGDPYSETPTSAVAPVARRS